MILTAEDTGKYLSNLPPDGLNTTVHHSLECEDKSTALKSTHPRQGREVSGLRHETAPRGKLIKSALSYFQGWILEAPDIWSPLHTHSAPGWIILE